MCAILKKWMGLLLAVAMMMGAVLPTAVLAEAQTLTAPALPNVGDTLHGFTVTELGTERIIDTPTVRLTHDKTGAEVLYIAADDPNCSFDITFRTPALDDKGLPHVFEHITISGSEKYPAQNLFFPLTTQTYNTFANAITMPNATTYPVSSLSEAQLLRLADYYLDGVFHPLIYQDERYTQREAWRYSLKDKDAPLEITGTVYNEMRGNQLIQNAASYDLKETLYPGSILSNNSGGDPDTIPEIVWEDLTAFHQAYYHPSNSLTVLYGNMDVGPFLALLDDYFGAYDRREFDIDDGKVPPVAEFTQKTFDFPVEAGSEAENASIVQYGYVAEGVTQADAFGLSVLTDLLTHESSPLTEAVRKALPKATLSAGVDITVPDPYIVFMLEGVDAADMEAFKAIVDEQLPTIAEEGIDADVIDAVMASIEFSNLLIPEISNLGVNLSMTLARMWAGKDSLTYLSDQLDALDMMKREAANGYFENLMKTYLLENPSKALIATSPVPGLAEEKTAAQAADLAEIKAAMTDEEIEKMIEDGKALDAWSQAEAPKELVESLTAVTADTLPEEIKLYDITETERDGYRTMTAQAAIGDIGRTAVYLDTSAIPQDMLHYYNLYTSLIGMVDTEHYGRQELQTLITRYLNGFSAQASALHYADDSYRPVLSLSWMTLNDDYEKALGIVRDMAFTSRTDDLLMLETVIGQQKLAMRNQLNSYAYAMQYTRAMATAYEDAAYSDYLSGLSYKAFLDEAEKMLKEDPDALVAKLNEARALIANRQNADVIFAGNEAGLAGFDASIGTLFDGTPAKPVEKAALSLPTPAKREALVTDSTVQYNLIYAPPETLGVEYSGKLEPISQLIFDAYLTPQIRHGIGAYGILNLMDKRGFAFISYRDPVVAETFAVYEGLAAFAETAPVTQDDLDRYIVSTYSAYAMPQGDLTGAIGAIQNRLLGWPDDEKLIRMREIKSATIEDLRALAPVFEKLAAEGVRSTSGGAAVIEKNAALFDEIIRTEGSH